MTASQLKNNSALQSAIDAANKKTLADDRKQFAKKATTEQRLAKLFESCSAVLDAYYSSVTDVEYGRKVSLAIRSLRSTVVDVRDLKPAGKAGAAVCRRA